MAIQKTEKHQRKEFRQQVCLQFKTCLQPYYKAKKFKTDVSITGAHEPQFGGSCAPGITCIIVSGFLLIKISISAGCKMDGSL